ncbi:MAG TPA: hypothetical protein VMK66_00890 [Myxococcales bacterium]|nr:hypothetical protein [Myxococcales bacterium]
MNKTLVALTIGICAAAATLAAKGKDRYLVIAPHTAESCLSVLDDINQHQAKLLEKIDWGCAAGDHTGYVAVEADSADAALRTLPAKAREGARAVKLVKFSPQQIRQFHDSK